MASGAPRMGFTRRAHTVGGVVRGSVPRRAPARASREPDGGSVRHDLDASARESQRGAVRQSPEGVGRAREARADAFRDIVVRAANHPALPRALPDPAQNTGVEALGDQGLALGREVSHKRPETAD